ncbi:MAG: MgtC/SapB family protein [Anaerolineae bacterium]|nr:MgtC/SapB family protein [Anaerolineae bacterium]
MSLILQVEILLELVLAAFLGMVIGLEREYRNQPAGLRTHMLVGVGSCLFTVLSIYAFPGTETGRVAAQIVVGIGFLGAGTIINRKGQAHHLTTAASIWATAAVGMAVGTGAWFLALGASLLIWIILAVVRVWSKSNPPPLKDEAPEDAEQ